MKSNFWKLFLEEAKKRNLITDILNTVIGLVLLVAIILFILFPGNVLILSLLFIAAGAMNLQTGFRYYKDKKKRTSGMCFIMLGFIILIVGVLVLRTIWK
jgi:hypothetical protein